MTFRGKYSAVLSIVLAASWLAFTAQRMKHESDLALQGSDVAFNEGRLRDALQEAERASRASVPGAQSVQHAEQRLRAIAVGSEATGRRRTALLAWSGVAATHNEVDGVACFRENSVREAAQHIKGLLPTRKSEARDNELLPSGRAAIVAAGITERVPGRAAPLFLVAIVLLTLVVSSYEATGFVAKKVVRRRFIRWLLLAVAGGVWCLGWAFV